MRVWRKSLSCILRFVFVLLIFFFRKIIIGEWLSVCLELFIMC